MITFYLLLAHSLYLRYSTTFKWLPAYLYGTLLLSTGPLPISLVLYYLLLAPCLSLWYSITFYLAPAYTYGILLPSIDPLPIPMILHYLALDHCLFLWYSTTFYLALLVPMVLYYILLAPCLFLWYSTIFYWLTPNTYCILLSSTGPLPMPIVIHYLHLALPFVPPIPMILYYLLLAPCLSLWYSPTFRKLEEHKDTLWESLRSTSDVWMTIGKVGGLYYSNLGATGRPLR